MNQLEERIKILEHENKILKSKLLQDKSIRQSRQTLRTVLDSIDAFIYVSRFDTFEMLFANKHVRKSYGDNIEGKKCWEILGENMGKPCSYCPYPQLMKNSIPELGKTYNWVHKGIHSNKWFDCFGSAIEWIDGQTVHMEYAIDITERKQNEIALIRAKEKAEEADKLKSTFLANMSHEIRTPMNGILGFASLIQVEVDEKISPRTALYAQIINNSCRLLLQLLDDIIDISKLESNQMKIFLTNSNISKLLSDLLPLFKQLLQEKEKDDKVEIIFENANLHETVLVDAFRLQQVITNLISNAIKFTDKGSIIFGFKRVDDDFLMFYVKDTGEGIKKKYHKTIFERFRQVEEEQKRNTSGTGLGLAISKNIVELMGGKIWVESKPGQGSTFYFTIKAQKTLN